MSASSPTPTADLRQALVDLHPEPDDLRTDVIDGLSSAPKQLSCKYLYDERGSKLFDQICELPEYYPTRTEIAIMQYHGSEMAEHLGKGCLVIEYGSGSSLKTEILLDRLQAPAGYVPVDISREHLLASAGRIAARHPELQVIPVCADFTRPFSVPSTEAEPRRRVVYFPGSTLGNFTEDHACQLLSNIAETSGSGGGLLIGIDLVKDAETLERAYDDAQGVTAAFNLNLLTRINRELGADFAVERFRHRAQWDPEHARVELSLVSTREQQVHIDDQVLGFREGEAILTEYSHKYTLERFRSLANDAGLIVQKVWTDEQALFSVQYLSVR